MSNPGFPTTELERLRTAVVLGDATVALAVTEKALEAGIDPLHIVNDWMIPAMDEVGARFARQEYFVPQMLRSTRAMKVSMAVLRPRLVTHAPKPLGRVVLGTVQGDMHDIGKNLVTALLEGGGFEVTDLGVNVSAEKFIVAARDKRAHIVGLSALLTTTMLNMASIIAALKQAGLCPPAKILVGGAPVTKDFAERIGADGYSNNAPGAVSLAKAILEVANSRWHQPASSALS